MKLQADGGIVREDNASVIPTCQSFDTSRQGGFAYGYNSPARWAPRARRWRSTD